MECEATFLLDCPQQAEHPRESQKRRHSENDPLNRYSALSTHVRLPEPMELPVCLHVSWVFQNALCSKVPRSRSIRPHRNARISPIRKPVIVARMMIVRVGSPLDAMSRWTSSADRNPWGRFNVLSGISHHRVQSELVGELSFKYHAVRGVNFEILELV